MNDFKPMLILAVVILSAHGAEAVWHQGRRLSGASRWATPVSLAIGATVLAVVLHPPGASVALAVFLLALGVAVLAAYQARSPVLAVVIITTLMTGLFFAYADPATWRTSREWTEAHQYGGTVTELIHRRAPGNGVQRPARVPL